MASFSKGARCPACQSQNLARSQRKNTLERLAAALSWWPMRCMACNERWWVRSREDPRRMILKRRAAPHVPAPHG